MAFSLGAMNLIIFSFWIHRIIQATLGVTIRNVGKCHRFELDIHSTHRNKEISLYFLKFCRRLDCVESLWRLHWNLVDTQNKTTQAPSHGRHFWDDEIITWGGILQHSSSKRCLPIKLLKFVYQFNTKTQVIPLHMGRYGW